MVQRELGVLCSTRKETLADLSVCWVLLFTLLLTSSFSQREDRDERVGTECPGLCCPSKSEKLAP